VEHADYDPGHSTAGVVALDRGGFARGKGRVGWTSASDGDLEEPVDHDDVGDRHDTDSDDGGNDDGDKNNDDSDADDNNDDDDNDDDDAVDDDGDEEDEGKDL
jgi:hypothetical protein